MKLRYKLLILTLLMPCLALAATLTVKQDGSGDYAAIQAAVDAASPGDTVLVYPGRYFENIGFQTNNITLMSLEGVTGEPAYIDSTVIDGNNTDTCIRVWSDNTVIRGFSVTRGLTTGAGAGIGVQRSASIINCKVFNNTAPRGAGITISSARVFLSGVEVFDNYALYTGGGINLFSNWDVTFDPVNRCSIYNNRAGSGQDIYVQDARRDLNMPLNTFSIANPDTYHAIYLSYRSNDEIYHINFDILNAHHQELDCDIYVSPEGDDSNDGQSPETAFKTIHNAIYWAASDSLNPVTVHILPGVYSRTDNEQIFPIPLRSWVILQGSGIDATHLILEPHPVYNDGYGHVDTMFSPIKVYGAAIADMKLTSRNTDSSCALSGSLGSTVDLKNIHIESFYPEYREIISLFTRSKRKMTWDNITIENIATSNDGLIKVGLGFWGSIKNSRFLDVTSTFQSASVGTQLIGIQADKSFEFENCQFSNLTLQDDDSIPIAISGMQSPQQQNHFSLRNCLFSNNYSQFGLASVVGRNNPLVDITNCTFAGNQGDNFTLQVGGNVNITNSVFYNDTPYQIREYPRYESPNDHGSITVDHSVVKDGVNGILLSPIPGSSLNFLPGSIDTDPLFLGGDDIHNPLYYSLSAASPCINSGTPDTTGLNLPPYDLAGNWRIWDGRIDMGCFEYGSEPWVSVDDPTIPPTPAVSLDAFPNPFKAFTNIRVNVPQGGLGKAESASINIYNIKGQKVKTIALDPSKAGEQFTYWDGRDSDNRLCSSGIYLLNLTVNGKNVSSKKVTLVR